MISPEEFRRYRFFAEIFPNTSSRFLIQQQPVRRIDVGQINNAEYFIQRLYVGIEPEEQTSRAMKDKFGVFAYA
ncbi:MAG: hypothetical protein HGA25_09920, partial [Clostridiales bacterium]|nr:hypothetical protein [Clostridiales bacterium]